MSDPMQSYAWWISDLREATTRTRVIRYGQWMLQCEGMALKEAKEAERLLISKLTFPRSNREKRLIEAWEAKVKDLSSLQPKS